MAVSVYGFTTGPGSTGFEFFPIIIEFPVSFSPSERNIGFRLKDSDSWANSPGYKSGWYSLLPSGDFDDLFPDDKELKHPLTFKVIECLFQSRLSNWTAKSTIYP